MEPDENASSAAQTNDTNEGSKDDVPKNMLKQSKKRKSSESAVVVAPSDVSDVVEGTVSVLPETINVQPEPKRACRIDLSRTRPLKLLDPANCSDIIDQMYKNYYELEIKYTAKPYLDRQRDINAKMRAILVDWLVEVHYKFKLQSATLWLCVNILDRYLEIAQTVRADLQLVGVSSLLIACKFEEIYPPEVRDCVYITDYAYTREQVLLMESQILRQLDYQICVPTGYHFMTRYLNSFNATDQIRYLAFYYAERNLQEYDMLNYPPNQFVAAAVFAALNCRPAGDPSPASSAWTVELSELTAYAEGDLIQCASTILKHVQEETVTASKRQLVAAKKKYAAEKYNGISSLPVPILAINGFA